jgi:hypothetical protein
MPFALFRDAALCQGFAWAAPASERYGAAIAELARSTQLLGALAETYPHRYAGAIVVNAPVGGSRLAFDYFMHVAALFDVFFPDVVALECERGMTPPKFGAFGGAVHQRAMAGPFTLQRMASIHLPGRERFDPAGVGHTVLWGDPTAPDAQAAFVSLGELFVYRVVLVETADRYGVRVVQTFEALKGPDGDALMALGGAWQDGLHVDEAVHRFVAELFREHEGMWRMTGA